MARKEWTLKELMRSVIVQDNETLLLQKRYVVC